jgi:hypothetical protein
VNTPSVAQVTHPQIAVMGPGFLFWSSRRVTCDLGDPFAWCLALSFPARLGGAQSPPNGKEGQEGVRWCSCGGCMRGANEGLPWRRHGIDQYSRSSTAIGRTRGLVNVNIKCQESDLASRSGDLMSGTLPRRVCECPCRVSITHDVRYGLASSHRENARVHHMMPDRSTSASSGAIVLVPDRLVSAILEVKSFSRFQAANEKLSRRSQPETEASAAFLGMHLTLGGAPDVRQDSCRKSLNSSWMLLPCDVRLDRPLPRSTAQCDRSSPNDKKWRPTINPLSVGASRLFHSSYVA